MSDAEALAEIARICKAALTPQPLVPAYMALERIQALAQRSEAAQEENDV